MKNACAVNKCPTCGSKFYRIYTWERRGRKQSRRRCLSCWNMHDSVEWWEQAPDDTAKTDEYPKAKVR